MEETYTDQPGQVTGLLCPHALFKLAVIMTAGDSHPGCDRSVFLASHTLLEGMSPSVSCLESVHPVTVAVFNINIQISPDHSYVIQKPFKVTAANWRQVAHLNLFTRTPTDKTDEKPVIFIFNRWKLIKNK